MKKYFFYFLMVFFYSSWGIADTQLLHQKAAQAFIDAMSRQYHFDKMALTHILKQAQFQSKIIESMERPYEKKSWDTYKALFLTPQRVQAGLSFWKKNQVALNQASKKYGVPPSIIVAILGVETLYGERQGSYRVLDALTTLAFYYPKRAPFFQKELKEFLLLSREHQQSPFNYVGSYAGAIGKPQFMPSSYRFYAIDSQHKGFSDLIHNDQDAIYSIANYLSKNGWKRDQQIAKRTYTRHISSKDTLLVFENQNHSTEYWIGYPNFKVITRYNTSPQYAMVVYLLANELEQRQA